MAGRRWLPAQGIRRRWLLALGVGLLVLAVGVAGAVLPTGPGVPPTAAPSGPTDRSDKDAPIRPVWGGLASPLPPVVIATSGAKAGLGVTSNAGRLADVTFTWYITAQRAGLVTAIALGLPSGARLTARRAVAAGLPDGQVTPAAGGLLFKPARPGWVSAGEQVSVHVGGMVNPPPGGYAVTVTLEGPLGAGLTGHQPLGSGRTPVLSFTRPYACTVPREPGWIAAENQLPGGIGWRPPKRVPSGLIEGWADHVSAVCGDTVRLHLSADSASVRVEAWRMGWYGGAGGRLIWTSGPAIGGLAPRPTFIRATDTVSAANWPVSLAVPIDGRFVPGDYVFRLVGAGREVAYVPLTVRDDASHAALVIQNSTATWQAYNLFGEYSLYRGPAGYADRSRMVTFDRPYVGFGDGQFFGFELPLVQYVERKGYDVTYWTDNDLDRRPGLLLNHKALVTLTHDEYWSVPMRDGLARALGAGVNVALLGANNMYWRARFEPAASGPDRNLVVYRDGLKDPVYRKNPALATTLWAYPKGVSPPQALLGSSYGCSGADAPLVVMAPGAWPFAGTGVRQGDRFPHLVYREYDRFIRGLPAPGPVQILAHSPAYCSYARPGTQVYADLTYTTWASGAGVLDVGTMGWICQLDASCVYDHNARTQAFVQRVTGNVLDAFGAGPAGRAHPTGPPYGTDLYPAGQQPLPIPREQPAKSPPATVPTLPAHRP